MWIDNLQNVYSSFSEFESCFEVYNLAHRLGFETAKEAWQANPRIQGSVNPADYKTVCDKRTKRNRKARESRRIRTEALEACGLVRGRASNGRVIWE